MLLVDVSASRMFGSTDRLKKNIITEIAAVLAFSAAQNNDKVGCIFFSDRVEKFIPPKKGRSHILMIIRELIGFRPESTGTKLSEPVRFPDQRQQETLHDLHPLGLHGFVRSDKAALDDALKIAGGKHDLVGIRVYDPRETELPDVGIVELKDAESGRKVWVDTSSRAVREHYARDVGATQRRDRLDAQAQPHRFDDDLDRRRLRGRTVKTVQTAMKRLFAIALLLAARGRPGAERTDGHGAHRAGQHHDRRPVRPDGRGGQGSGAGGASSRNSKTSDGKPPRTGQGRTRSTRSNATDATSGCASATRLAAFEEGKWNLGLPAVLYADKNIVDTLRSARFALSGGGHVPDRLDLAVDLRPQTAAQPAVPFPRRSADTPNGACWPC